MTIASGEMRLYYAAERNQSDPSANGGRPSQNAVTCGQYGNIWPKVNEAEQASGGTRCEKLFWRLTSAETGGRTLAFLAGRPVGGEYEWIVAGDQDNYQSDLPASPRRYSVGALSPAAAGATTITVTLADASLADCFAAGDTLALTQGGTPDFVSGASAAATAQAVSASGATLTITLAAPLARAFSAPSQCASCIEAVTFAPSVQVTGGTLAAPIEVNNPGTIRQDWTGVYGAEGLAITGDSVGALGAFSTSEAIAPNNPAAGAPYFSIPPEAHGDTPSGTITFSTWAAAIPVFRFKRTPPGIASPPLETTYLVCACES